MDEQKERIELAPPNHGDGIVYEVNGKPVSKMTYHRHKSGKSETQRDTVREKKPHELAGYFSEGKKVSRTTEWRRRTKAARKEREMANPNSPHQQKLKSIEAEFGSATDADRLRMTYTELVRRISVESHSQFITDVNWDDLGSVDKRSRQLQNLKNLLAVTKQMTELIDRLESDHYQTNIRTKEEKDEQNKVIAAAEVLLLKRAK
ncbi:hypothetical protein [Methylomonas koyamae]|uniref:hypothetical protein n=2 Tax=Methylomonas koyamae TaxID=702114 RepID=UPI001C7F87FB|nr:hypothetical protein [Methylomonas koyamae]